MVGFLASIAAVIFGWIPDGHFSIDHAVLLCASSVATAFIASLVLGERQTLHTLHAPLPKTLGSPWPHSVFFLFLAVGMIMIGVIIGSRKMGINPDNVATPIAASLGDLITLALLSGISWGLYKELGEEHQKAFVSPWSFHVHGVSLAIHPLPLPFLFLGHVGCLAWKPPQLVSPSQKC